MRRIFTLPVLFLALFLSLPLFAQQYSEEQKDILIIQDTRNKEDYGKLLEYLKSDNDDVVTTALIAFANIQDSAYSKEVGEVLLNSSKEGVQEAAAFALGQIGGEVALEYLEEAFAKDNIYRINEEIIDALGKAGDENTLAMLSRIENPDLQKAAALAIARLAIRGIKSAEGVPH